MRYVETVTVLITDVVGSTALESRIGPTRADALREEHFQLIRDAVQEDGGKEVKNTGDEHFAKVCEFYESNQLLFWVARGRLAWAEALAGRGAAGRASEQAQLALDPAHKHAFAAIEARAAALVSATPVVTRGSSR